MCKYTYIGNKNSYMYVYASTCIYIFIYIYVCSTFCLFFNMQVWLAHGFYRITQIVAIDASVNVQTQQQHVCFVCKLTNMSPSMYTNILCVSLLQLQALYIYIYIVCFAICNITVCCCI